MNKLNFQLDTYIHRYCVSNTINMSGRVLQKCSNCAIESFFIAKIISEL